MPFVLQLTRKILELEWSLRVMKSVKLVFIFATLDSRSQQLAVLELENACA
jgi:hypothetical protein